MSIDINAIGKQFTDFYYATFDADRKNLASLYRPTSMLSWEGEPIVGDSAIIAKIVGLPFEKVLHKVTTIDVQPSSSSVPNLLVSVTGQLVVDDSPNPLQYSQIFHLISENSSYYVFNDIFRLNYS